MPELIYAGLFSVGIAYTLQMVAQGYASATIAAFILSLESVFAAISGWLFLSPDAFLCRDIGMCNDLSSYFDRRYNAA